MLLVVRDQIHQSLEHGDAQDVTEKKKKSSSQVCLLSSLSTIRRDSQSSLLLDPAVHHPLLGEEGDGEGLGGGGGRGCPGGDGVGTGAVLAHQEGSVLGR